MQELIKQLKANIVAYTEVFDNPDTDDAHFVMAREQRYVCQSILTAIEAGRVIR